ncbi:hypothetical protein D6D01_06097 [Aureobasidium pullulans]|uniref:Uncharacterized protein n=1 Tax=Aureobasidium pullulans TaxID=5580 RepID=A0A4S9L2S7_AURPU|nr:hypothetical protein D6D01_06097 [Aureobasidium pullulans]
MSNVKDMEDKRYYSSELLLNLECLVQSRFVFEPSLITAISINKFTLASTTHSGRRARAWQRRTPTLHNISERRLPLGTQADLLLQRSSASKPKQPFTHLNIVKAEDLDDAKTDKDISPEPYVYSTPGPSPKSSSRSLNSTGTGRMSFPDSASEDRFRLAELATARLERQSRRIIENDPTIPISKIAMPRIPRKVLPNQRLPLDYPESSDGDMASTSRTSRNESPLDVHAKVFRPGSRDSSISRTREPPRKDSADLSLDDGEFQLVTGKKTKPSSRPTGLNAHEVKVDEKTSTIDAPCNKHEINEVFGNDLPPMAHFLSSVGNINGEVGFAMHPNGDISGHQWSANDFQWYNIGLFSNIRRRTEGMLASHRLKGENDLHSLLLHTLSYFRAVALQQEAAIMKMPFGMKELQAAMPKIPVDRTVRKAPIMPAAAVTQAGSESDHRRPEKKDQTRTSSLGPDRQPWLQGYNSRVRSKPKVSSVPRAPASNNLSFQRDFLSSAANHNTPSVNPYDNSPQSLTALNNLSFGIFSTRMDDDLIDNSSQFPNLKTPASERLGVGEHSQYLDSFLPKSMPQMPTSQLYSPIPNLDFLAFLENPQTTSPDQEDSPASRKFTKASVDKIFSAAAFRNTDLTTGTRTVLHDPFQSHQPSKMVTATLGTPLPGPQTSEKTHNDIAWSNTPIGQFPCSYTLQASTPTSDDDPAYDPAYDLRISEPEIRPKSKSMEIVDINLPHMTTEGLAIYSRPSPQNFNGPFFMGSPDIPSEASRRSHDQELHDWFYSGLTTIERQNEHFQYIKTAHCQAPTTTQGRLNSGPIGTPHKTRESEPFNEVTTRLFLSMHESLAQYTQGPPEQRRGYLAPFCDPPEWCVDKSANGNDSFFGEEWGQPPERISRDSRYRPLPFESKFDPFDSHRGANGVGMHASNGRLRYGSNVKY